MREARDGVESGVAVAGGQELHAMVNDAAPGPPGIRGVDPTFEPIHGIGAQTLMESIFDPPVWIVESFLSTSTTCVLAAPPKTGKSLFALQLAHCVATGQPFLGLPTIASPVLYLALEDVEFRLQSRLWGMTDETSDRLTIATRAHGLHGGLIEQLREHMSRNPGTKLIVIDTLQVVRDGGVDYKYGSDYDDMRSLKQLTDEFGICLIVVTHLRKMESQSDPFADIIGTTGITGAVDEMLVMKKSKRSSSDCSLYVTGRDVPDMRIKLRRELLLWEMTEKVSGEELEAESIPAVVKAVVTFIKERGTWSGTMSELRAVLEIDEVSVAALGKFLSQHREWMEGRGVRYLTRRTSASRLVTLAPVAFGDGVGVDEENHDAGEPAAH